MKTTFSQDDAQRMATAVVALDSIAAIVQLSDPMKPEHKIKVIETLLSIAQTIEDMVGEPSCSCVECRRERENEEDSYSPHMN